MTINGSRQIDRTGGLSLTVFRPRGAGHRPIRIRWRFLPKFSRQQSAVDGLGIAVTIEALAEPFLRSGQLVRVLEDWSPCFEGFFLYYPCHRQVPAALRALIDIIRTSRASAAATAVFDNPFTAD